MIRILSILTLLFISTLSYAQSFEKEESLSLSQGAYSEVQDEDSIVQIGSALYNVNTGEIVGVTFVEDEVSSGLEEELIGRWLAVDPWASRFVRFSPYSSMDNNPLNIIDPTGKGGEAVVSTDEKGKTSATVKSTIYIYTDDESLTDEKMENFRAGLENSLNTQFNSKKVDGSGKTIKVIKPKVDVNGQPVKRGDENKIGGQTVRLDVKFQFEVKFIKGDATETSLAKVTQMAKKTKTASGLKENYYLVHNGDAEAAGVNHNHGGNSGVLNINANEKAWSHELSHNFGWIDDDGVYGSHSEDPTSIMVYPPSVLFSTGSVTQDDVNRLNGKTVVRNGYSFGYGKKSYIYSSKDLDSPLNQGANDKTNIYVD